MSKQVIRGFIVAVRFSHAMRDPKAQVRLKVGSLEGVEIGDEAWFDLPGVHATKEEARGKAHEFFEDAITRFEKVPQWDEVPLTMKIRFNEAYGVRGEN